jgi:hypothetical protein
MFKQHMKSVVILLAVAAVLICLPYILARQHPSLEKSGAPARSRIVLQEDVESKLSQKADFIPERKSFLDQLVGVAQHYRIPMGIEWIKPGSSQELDVPLPKPESSPTVRDLLQAIVSRLPSYQMTVQNGIVYVAQPVFAVDAKNFLNVRIEEFRVENENLLDAEEHLHLSIDMTLHPDKYEEGYMGGYGYNPDDVFAKRKITFTGEDLTVREILDGLVKASGNALWIAHFDPDDFKPAKSSTTKSARTSDQEEDKSKYHWEFVPLVEKPGTRQLHWGR